MTDRDRTTARRRRVPGVPRLPIALAALALIFAVALLAPIPSLPAASDASRVAARVEQRLPGWQVDRTRPSWEGAWTVVASCGDRQLGFQFVPGHGLRPGDAWLHPQDAFTRTRLRVISDNERYLVWFRNRLRPPALACRSELARDDEHRSGQLD